jgi:serine/threonine protein kinase
MNTHIHLINRSRYSSIYRIHLNDVYIAVKIIDKKTLDNEYKYIHLNEIKNMQKLPISNHIIKFYGYLNLLDKTYIFTEYMQYDFLNFITIMYKNKIPNCLIFYYFRQMANAVQDLHNSDFIHMDIKLENFTIDNNGVIKIIDFGYSIQTKNKIKKRCGTHFYISPEIINCNGIHSYDGKKSDIWSLGICLYAMINGHLPFKNIHNDTVNNNNNNGMDNYFNNVINSNYSELKTNDNDLKDLVSRMLEKKPENRVNIYEIINHNWFKKNYNYNYTLYNFNNNININNNLNKKNGNGNIYKRTMSDSILSSKKKKLN